MEKLIDLKLDHNEIDMILPDTFWDLHSLQWLSIRNNRLKALTDNLILRLPNLKWFTVDNNFISVLHDNLFSRNPDLELISMKDNQLKEVSFDFQNFNKLRFVDFEGNKCINSSVQWKRVEALVFNQIQKDIYKFCRQRINKVPP